MYKNIALIVLKTKISTLVFCVKDVGRKMVVNVATVYKVFMEEKNFEQFKIYRFLVHLNANANV